MKRPRVKVQYVLLALSFLSALLLGITMRNMNPEVTATDIFHLVAYAACSLAAFVFSFLASEQDEGEATT